MSEPHRVGNGFLLQYQQGKAVQEILNRYVSEELELRLGEDEEADTDINKDIVYIQGLAELFD